MYRTMRTHWQVTVRKYNDRDFFSQYSDAIWDVHINWLLSPRVWGYKASSGVGLSWEDLLEYDYRIRKEAMKRVTRNGLRLETALSMARECPVLMQRHFTLQLCTSGKRRGDSSHAGAQAHARQDGEGMSKVKRELEKELANVKRLRTQLQTQQGQLQNQLSNTASSHQLALTFPSAERKPPGKGGKGAGKMDPNRGSSMGEFNRIKRAGKLSDTLRGSTQKICRFFSDRCLQERQHLHLRTRVRPLSADWPRLPRSELSAAAKLKSQPWRPVISAACEATVPRLSQLANLIVWRSSCCG